MLRQVDKESRPRTAGRTPKTLTSQQEQTNDYIEQLYRMQPEPRYRARDFAPLLSNDEIVSELNKKRELSPHAKLRILQRKLETQRRLQKGGGDSVDSSIEREVPTFEGYIKTRQHPVPHKLQALSTPASRHSTPAWNLGTQPMTVKSINETGASKDFGVTQVIQPQLVDL